MTKDEKVELVATVRRADVAPMPAAQLEESRQLVYECALSYRAELVPLPRGLVLEEWTGSYCEQFLG